MKAFKYCNIYINKIKKIEKEVYIFSIFYFIKFFDRFSCYLI